MDFFFLDKDGKTAGPISEEILHQLYDKKAITKETLIWREGLGEWVEYQYIFHDKLQSSKKPPHPPARRSAKRKTKRNLIAFAVVLIAIYLIQFALSKISYRPESKIGQFFAKQDLKEISSKLNEKLPLNFSDQIIVQQTYPSNNNTIYYKINLHLDKSQIESVHNNAFKGVINAIIKNDDAQSSIVDTVELGASVIFKYYQNGIEIIGESKINKNILKKILDDIKQAQLNLEESDRKRAEYEMELEKVFKNDVFKKASWNINSIVREYCYDNNIEKPIHFFRIKNNQLLEIFKDEPNISKTDLENRVIAGLELEFANEVPRKFPPRLDQVTAMMWEKYVASKNISIAFFNEAVKASKEYINSIQHLNDWEKSEEFKVWLEIEVNSRIAADEELRNQLEIKKSILIQEQADKLAEQNDKIEEQNRLLKKIADGPSLFEKMQMEEKERERENEIRRLRQLQEEQTRLQRQNNELLEKQNRSIHQLQWDAY